MSAQPGMLAADVRLLRRDQLDENLTGGPGLQRLAEITHLPTGIASGQIETVDLPAGASTPVRPASGDDTFIHVIVGNVRVTWGDMARAMLAGAGDTLLIPAGTTFQAANPGPSTPLQFILVRGG